MVKLNFTGLDDDHPAVTSFIRSYTGGTDDVDTSPEAIAEWEKERENRRAEFYESSHKVYKLLKEMNSESGDGRRFSASEILVKCPSYYDVGSVRHRLNWLIRNGCYSDLRRDGDSYFIKS